MILIEPYKNGMASDIIELFHTAVHAIKSDIYSESQKEAWSPTPPNAAAWKIRLLLKQPLVAIKDDKVVGFMELDPDGHIDCAYVHPDFQGSGVGSLLFAKTKDIATANGICRLCVEASIVARPFFAKRDFVYLRENVVERNGQTLTNYSMELQICSKV